MKKSIILLTIVWVFQNCVAQSETITYENRSMMQQQFIYNYYKENELIGIAFSSTKDIDERVSELESQWAKSHTLTMPSLKRLDGYPLLVIANLAGAEDWAQDYVLKTYAVNAFIEDIKCIRDSGGDSIYLLNPGAYSNILLVSVLTQLDLEQWKVFYHAMSTLEEILKGGRYPPLLSESQQKILSGLDKTLKKSRPLLTLLDNIYNNHLSEACRILSKGIKNKTFKRFALRHPVELLIEKLNQHTMSKEAFELLDLTETATIDSEFPRTVLKELYLNVDKEDGLIRYQNAEKQPGSPLLVKSKHSYHLKGKFLDLTTHQQIDISEIRSDYIIIDFWATWCGPCNIEIPKLIELNNTIKKNDAVTFITIVTDALSKGKSKEDIMEFIKQKKINYAVLVDDPVHSLTKQFNVRGIPAKFLLDKKGHTLTRDADDGQIELSVLKYFLDDNISY